MLTRRSLLTVPLAAARGASSRGSMMWDYILRELREADERRREKLRAVRTKSDLEALGVRVRKAMQAAIGEFPARTPLNAKQTGVMERGDYVVEKIIFESRPSYFVTANLYRPKTVRGPLAAVIESCGHTTNGKASGDYQRVCIGLAKKGFIAMIFDPVGQGERAMYGGKAKPGTGEHAVAGKPAFLTGRTLTHYRMWDAMRALDYLETRPDVDKTRLGMVGHSGGGMMTLLTAPMEPRLKAVMSCCAVTSFYHKTKALLIADAEQIVPNIYANGIDHPELIAAVAPRAFLIGSAKKDYVPLDGARRTLEETKPLFEMAGIGDHFDKVETDDQHKLNLELREACYGWMMKHLRGEAGDTREPALEVAGEAELLCTPTGRVMDLPGARSIVDLNREYARGLAAKRKRPAKLPVVRAAASPERGIELPFTSTPGGGALIVLADPEGRESKRAQGLARAFHEAGAGVVAVDLRGWGETRPVTRGAQEGKFTWEDHFAYRSFELGRPLLLMRAEDLLVAVRQHGNGRKVYVVGLGAAGVAALHAAAGSDSIAGVAAVGSLGSFQDVVEQPVSPEPPGTLVPAALVDYDLPDLGAKIKPRPCLHSKDMLDAKGILEALRLA